MEKHIPISKMFWYLYELEKFESTTLEKQVIEKAKQAGFIVDDSSVEDLYKLAWVKAVTKHAEGAFKLEEAAEGEPLEVIIDNFNKLIELRNKQVVDTLELLAKKVIEATPAYQN